MTVKELRILLSHLNPDAIIASADPNDSGVHRPLLNLNVSNNIRPDEESDEDYPGYCSNNWAELHDDGTINPHNSSGITYYNVTLVSLGFDF